MNNHGETGEKLDEAKAAIPAVVPDDEKPKALLQNPTQLIDDNGTVIKLNDHTYAHFSTVKSTGTSSSNFFNNKTIF